MEESQRITIMETQMKGFKWVFNTFAVLACLAIASIAVMVSAQGREVEAVQQKIVYQQKDMDQTKKISDESDDKINDVYVRFEKVDGKINNIQIGINDIKKMLEDAAKHK